MALTTSAIAGPATSSTMKSAAGPVGGVTGSRTSLAKHVVPLPPIPGASGAEKPSSDTRERRNPFIMPPESELFTLRERQRRQAREERAVQRKLKVHEKSTYTSRLNAKNSSLRKTIMSPTESVEGRGPLGVDERGERGVSEETDFVLTATANRRLEKEDLTSYVNRKREMFLVQYTLGVKREEIRKLEEIALAEEQKLMAAEHYLKESAEMFDEFVKENDRNASEAVRMAEAAAKAKLEKTTEIKRLNTKLNATKNEISRNSESLTELRACQNFLHSLSPQEWHEQKKMMAKIKPRKSVEIAKEEQEERKPPGGNRVPGIEEVSEEECQLYFTSPAQLLQLFSELEEQNLALIQNSQETEELLEDLKQSHKDTRHTMDTQIHNLKRQVDLLMKAIELEEEKASDLEMKSKLLSYGEYKADDQEQMLAEIDKKVASVYVKCIGPNEANISSLNMLTAIEGCLEQLFETIESLPADKVEAAEKLKEKERRMRLRAEKMEEQRLYQEMKLRRMQERAHAGPCKTKGRKVMYRSEPPVMKKKQTSDRAEKEREEEEMMYFFT